MDAPPGDGASSALPSHTAAMNTALNLCLHYVEPAASGRRLAVTPAQLRAAVERLAAEGRRPAALADYLTAPPASGRYTLAFDDAQRSVLTRAAPLLRSLGVPATLFVPTASVGTSDEFLSWDELRALRDLGWTLGSHTVTHPRMSWRLYDEDAAAYAARLDEECARSREVMERELGVEVTLFAYPYGEAPPAAREAVRRAGYRAAFTVSDALRWDGDALAIPRLDGQEALDLVRPLDGPPVAISVVIPACERVEILSEVVRRLGAQSYPEDRFEVLVVDDGSRDDLSAALAGAGANVRLVSDAGERGVFGAGRARQRGADEARFDTLAFLDADVAVGRDYLWALDWVHRRAPRAVVLGYLSGYNLHDAGFVHTLDDLRGVDDPDRELAVIPDRSREPTLRGCLDNIDWLAEPWRLAYTGNLSLPRALLAEIGGFAKDFTGWGLEDIDLGYRLHRAGATWVFGRFAVGYHLVDPHEGPPRNPFRHPSPTRERFAGYLANLDRLRGLHPGDPVIEGFHAQSLADVDETCGRPSCVGVEVGGASSLDVPFHRALHRVQPGGMSTRELLDRLEYVRKVGATQVYILGGEPAEHPGFLTLLREARRAGVRWATVQTTAVPFGDGGLAMSAREAGLDQATVEVYGFDRETFARTTRRPEAFARFERGFAALREVGVRRSARVIVADETVAALTETLRRLDAEDVRVDEVAVVGEGNLARAEAAVAGRGATVVLVRT